MLARLEGGERDDGEGSQPGKWGTKETSRRGRERRPTIRTKTTRTPKTWAITIILSRPELTPRFNVVNHNNHGVDTSKYSS